MVTYSFTCVFAGLSLLAGLCGFAMLRRRA